MTEKELSVVIQGDYVVLSGELMVANRPNVNGVSYSKEVVASAANQLAEFVMKKVAFVFAPGEESLASPKIGDMVGTIFESKLEDDALTCSVALIDTVKGKPLAETLKVMAQVPGARSGLSYALIGNGNLVDDVVTSYSMESITIVPSEQVSPLPKEHMHGCDVLDEEGCMPGCPLDFSER